VLYVQESFLYRLSISKYKDRFILKGGVLFYGVYLQKVRPTKDLDFLLRNISNKPTEYLVAVKEILSIDVPDGVVYDIDNISMTSITEAADYKGLRNIIRSRIGTAKQKLQIDVGFSDLLYTGPVTFEYPRLLEPSTITLPAYSWESVVSEKFESIVKFGELNSRMKDFFDLHFLLSHHSFNGKILTASIQKTFKNRKTDVSETSNIFSESFLNNERKKIQWAAFVRKNEPQISSEFPKVIKDIMGFLGPVLKAIENGKEFELFWDVKKGIWRKKHDGN
jgi:predicted nucleotidyltransferase component of viral defense system